MAVAPKKTHLKKKNGAYYTPQHVAKSLVRWAVRKSDDWLLDPSCGNGRFLIEHRQALGVERDVHAVAEGSQNAPNATIVAADFFDWAAQTRKSFECAAGNPPFIRFQQFSGDVRNSARSMCSALGVEFSSLTSSWPFFLVVASSLLKQNGRIAFVVPAEVGHAPYARPLVRYLLDHFAHVQIIAVQEKVFPGLSEDVWLLYAAGFGRTSDQIGFTRSQSFRGGTTPPPVDEFISRKEWELWNERLRPFLLPQPIRAIYRELVDAAETPRLGDVARVGIGYVTGANNFFHLRPSEAQRHRIDPEFLIPAVRNSSFLRHNEITNLTVKDWLKRDERVLLLRIPRDRELPHALASYLNSAAGQKACEAYKCRTRTPWYVVPDVQTPDAFLAYMSTLSPKLVLNSARCTCTNSIHAVRFKCSISPAELQLRWEHPLAELSCEIEGHPLGGGLLKLEPREAANVALPLANLKMSSRTKSLINEGLSTMRRWRHVA